MSFWFSVGSGLYGSDPQIDNIIITFLIDTKDKRTDKPQKIMQTSQKNIIR